MKENTLRDIYIFYESIPFPTISVSGSKTKDKETDNVLIKIM